MATFSGREAFKTGFDLVLTRPKAVAIWGAVYFVFAFTPQWLAYLTVWPEIRGFMEGPDSSDSRAIDAAMLQLNAKLLVWQPVQLLGSLVAATVMYAAIIRAVLEPENDRWGYVRFGGQELWVGLVSIVAFVIFLVAILVISVPIIIAGAISAAASGGAQMSSNAIGLLIVICIVALGAMLWLSARFSMALPMSFSEQKFRLFESWPLTRGHAWKIVLVSLATVLMVIAVTIALSIVFLIVGGLVIGMFAVTGANVDQPVPGLLGWIILGVFLFSAVGSVATAAIYAIVYAPIVNIYRQLMAGAAS